MFKNMLETINKVNVNNLPIIMVNKNGEGYTYQDYNQLILEKVEVMDVFEDEETLILGEVNIREYFNSIIEDGDKELVDGELVHHVSKKCVVFLNSI